MILNTPLNSTDFNDIPNLHPIVSKLKMVGGTQAMKTFLREEDVPQSMKDVYDPQSFRSYFILDQEHLSQGVQFAKDNNVSIAWGLNTQDTIENQLESLEILENLDAPVSDILLGSELYLKKWRTGDTSKQGVSRQFLMADYWLYLEKIVPILREKYPNVNLLFVGASWVQKKIDHNNENIAEQEKYRKNWNTMLKWFLQEQDWFDQDWCQTSYHMYFRSSDFNQFPSDEEPAVDVVDLTYINDINTPVITELGSYIFEPDPRNVAFYNDIYEAIGSDMGRMGMHMIYWHKEPFISPKFNNVEYPHHWAAFYGPNGMTPKGAEFFQWAESVTDNIPVGPTGETGASGPTGGNGENKKDRMILNAPIEFFRRDSIDLAPLPSQVSHLRFFGFIVGREDENGLPTRPTNTEASEYIQYLKDNNLKGYYTIPVGDSFPIQDEINYLKEVINMGADITHIQIGQELWLGKYVINDQSKPKVYERITIKDYLNYLDEIIPLLKQNFPNVKIVVLGASHQYEEQQVQDLITKFNEDNRDIDIVIDSIFKKDGRYKGSDYRTLFTDETCRYILNSEYDDLGISIHYYCGARPDLQPENGEEAIFEDINFDPFLNHIRHYLPEVEISYPEAGWYPEIKGEGKSEFDLNKKVEFLIKMKEGLKEDDIPGLHVLFLFKEGYHNWYSINGPTEIYYAFNEHFNEISGPTGETGTSGPTGETGTSGPTGETGENVVILSSFKIEEGDRWITVRYFWSDDTVWSKSVLKRFAANLLYIPKNSDLGKPKSDF